MMACAVLKKVAADDHCAEEAVGLPDAPRLVFAKK
jgi:hypothetical protein